MNSLLKGFIQNNRANALFRIASSLSLFLFLYVPAAVVWSADNPFCLSCHGDETLKKKDVRGRDVSLFVSEAEFEMSVHGRLSCSDCHTSIKDDVHAQGGRRSQIEK